MSQESSDGKKRISILPAPLISYESPAGAARSSGYYTSPGLPNDYNQFPGFGLDPYSQPYPHPYLQNRYHQQEQFGQYYTPDTYNRDGRYPYYPPGRQHRPKSSRHRVNHSKSDDRTPNVKRYEVKITTKTSGVSPTALDNSTETLQTESNKFRDSLSPKSNSETRDYKMDLEELLIKKNINIKVPNNMWKIAIHNERRIGKFIKHFYMFTNDYISKLLRDFCTDVHVTCFEYIDIMTGKVCGLYPHCTLVINNDIFRNEYFSKKVRSAGIHKMYQSDQYNLEIKVYYGYKIKFKKQNESDSHIASNKNLGAETTTRLNGLAKENNASKDKHIEIPWFSIKVMPLSTNLKHRNNIYKIGRKNILEQRLNLLAEAVYNNFKNSVYDHIPSFVNKKNRMNKPECFEIVYY
jgi:hypothetical protein